MRAFFVFLSCAVLLFVTACEQQPVGLPVVGEDLPWTTLFTFPHDVYAGPVGGASPDDVYLMRRNFQTYELLHFDGSAWTPVPSPQLGGWPLWVAGPNDVYVANYGHLLHYDGLSWTEIPVPALFVTGAAANDVYVSGANRLNHYDGSSWTEILVGVSIYEVWAGPQSHAVVISTHYFSPDSLRWWDGSDWTVSAAPGNVRAIWGPSFDNLVAVGNDGAGGGVVWTWDGAAWAAAVLPAGVRGLTAIDGSDIDNLIAVGYDGTVLHHNGVQWQSIDLGTDKSIYNVWVADPATVYVTGDRGAAFRGSPAGGWSSLFDYPLSGDGPLWVESGTSMRLGARNEGVHRLERGVWGEEHITSYGYLDAIDGRRPDDVYAAFRYEGLYHYDGLSWSAVLDTVEGVLDIHVLPNGHVSLIDARDGLFVFDGAQWRHVSTLNGYQSGVWASAIDDVWIATLPELLHYDGESVRVVRKSDQADFFDVWGRDPRDVYVVGEGILHYDGTDWEKVGPDGAYRHVIGDAGRVLASGGRRSAYFADGYWHLAAESQYFVQQLVRGVDGSVYALTVSPEQTQYSIRRLR